MKKSNDENDKEELTDFIESRIIKDPKIIKECDKKTPRTPKDETEEDYDKPFQEKNLLKKSEKIIGQVFAIMIAYCSSNPEIDMLILNGRHRFLQNPKWKKIYVRINNWQEYCKFRFNLNIHKRKKSAEIIKILPKCGEELIKQGIAREKIASILWKDFPGISRATILKSINPEWKNSIKAANRLGKTKNKSKKNIDEKCQQENESLRAQIAEAQRLLCDREIQEGNKSSRLRILETEREIEVDGIKLTIQVEKDGTDYIVKVIKR